MSTNSAISAQEANAAGHRSQLATLLAGAIDTHDLNTLVGEA
jgi:hypothetical protein